MILENRTNSELEMPSAKEHAISEINALINTLELTGGDSSTAQYGGSYSSIRARLKADGLQGYEVHHMPSNAVQNAPMGELPSLALKAGDHAKTDSYRGKQNRKTDSFLPGGPPSVTYRNETARMIENDRYADVVAAEVYNIKDRFGNKYDGAIAQYLESVKEYISEHGIPEAVYSLDKETPNDYENTQSRDNNSALTECVRSECNENNEKEITKMSKNSFLDKIKASFKNKTDNSNPNDGDATEDSGESSDTERGERVREHTSPRENSFLESIKVDTKENNQNSQNTQVTAPAQSNNQSFSNNGNGQTQGGESGHGSSRGEGGGRGGR